MCKVDDKRIFVKLIDCRSGDVVRSVSCSCVLGDSGTFVFPLLDSGAGGRREASGGMGTKSITRKITCSEWALS